jgi:hypothetical protein
MTLFERFEIDEELKSPLEKRGVHIPTYNIFEDENAIQIEEVTYVNENLIPVLDYKIIVNKESLHRHKQEWKELFEVHYEKVLSGPPKWGEHLLDLYIRRGIQNKFKNYLEQPMHVIQKELLSNEKYI